MHQISILCFGFKTHQTCSAKLVENCVYKPDTRVVWEELQSKVSHLYKKHEDVEKCGAETESVSDDHKADHLILNVFGSVKMNHFWLKTLI